MKKYEKEVLQSQLNDEKKVLKKLERNYSDALDEINDKIAILLGRDDASAQHVVYQVEFQKSLKKQVEAILETLHSNEFETVSEYLTKSYDEGYLGTMYSLHNQGIPLIMPIDQEQVLAAIQHETKLSESLYTSLGKDIKVLNKQIASEISRGIAGGHMYREIARNIAGYAGIGKNKAMRIARTEAHRIQSKATADAQFKAKEKGADIVKIWSAALDAKTRPTHRKLDGQIRELEEPFEADGLKAMRPAEFGRPEEDINCRCRCNSRARWLLDVPYTKWDANAPVIIDDDGTTQFSLIESKNYEDFKKKYKQASERVRESVQKMNDESTWIPRKTSAMKRNPADFRKTTDAVLTHDTYEELPNFKNASSISQAIETGKTLTMNGTFEVNGIHLNTVNAFTEAMYNVKQRFGRNLNIAGVKAVKAADAKYHQGSYDPTTKFVSLKGGNSANALATYKANAEKFFKSGWNASSDVYGTFYHEIGHSVWDDLPATAKNEIRNLYKETRHSAYEKWMAMGGSHSGYSQAEVFGKELSRYALENEQEFFSETFSQIMSGRMKPVSRQVNSILNQHYKINAIENIGKSSTIELDLQFFAEKDIKNQESNSLKRAIRKYEKQIQDHTNKINNPEQYIEDWDSLSSLKQEGLKKHWKKEINNFNTSINDRISELKERGDYDE